MATTPVTETSFQPRIPTWDQRKIGVSGLLTNPQGTSSYMRGDTITLQADVKNTGDLDYTNGGTLEFFFKNGATTTVINAPLYRRSTPHPARTTSPQRQPTTPPICQPMSGRPPWRPTCCSSDMGSGNNVAKLPLTTTAHRWPNPQVLDSTLCNEARASRFWRRAMPTTTLTPLTPCRSK